jgi:hypothetical protein
VAVVQWVMTEGGGGVFPLPSWALIGTLVRNKWGFFIGSIRSDQDRTRVRFMDGT